MKNTLTIKVDEQCSCECLDSVYDGNNSIFVSLDVPDETNPKLVVCKDGMSSATTLKPKQLNNVGIGMGDFTALIDGKLTFQYVSDDRTGSIFTITFPEKVEGNMMLKRVDDYTYNAQFTEYGNNGGSGSEYKLPPATTTTLGGVIVGENIEVETDGKISVPKITELEEDMYNLFTSVSNGKREIALAITDKGVPTESNATFSEMATNISQIPSTTIDTDLDGYDVGTSGVITGDYETEESNYTNVRRLIFPDPEYIDAQLLANFLGMKLEILHSNNGTFNGYLFYHNETTKNGIAINFNGGQLHFYYNGDKHESVCDFSYTMGSYIGIRERNTAGRLDEVVMVGTPDNCLLNFKNYQTGKSTLFSFGITRGLNVNTNEEELIYFSKCDTSYYIYFLGEKSGFSRRNSLYMGNNYIHNNVVTLSRFIDTEIIIIFKYLYFMVVGSMNTVNSNYKLIDKQFTLNGRRYHMLGYGTNSSRYALKVGDE